MEPLQQLGLLSQDMSFEMDGAPLAGAAPACDPVIDGKRLGSIPVSHAQMPNGKTITLLKTLLTSACERNCYYCPFRSGRDLRRATFKPDEMAGLFNHLYKARLVEGIFLSSGIIGGGMRTQDKLLDTAEILRKKYQYKGYLHLKIMPGAEKDQVQRALELASRVSVNLEAPNTARLQKLAPLKEFTEELVQPLLWAQEIKAAVPPTRAWNGRWPSLVTQFVVGAVGESDLELLSTTEALNQKVHLQRAYFSRFNPVVDTPFENLPPESVQREHRLYQSSFLLRDYGFSLEELPFEPGGNLPRHTDPKLAWAQAHLSQSPVELNRASREMLLRVPGFGPKMVETLLRERRRGKIRSLEALRKIGVQVNRAAPFILLDGFHPARQMSFWTG